MFPEVFYGLLVACVGFYLITMKGTAKYESSSHFRLFQLRYIGVYALAVAGDWLQGPHVYALYQSYNLSKHDIELLFICGFASSLLMGTVIGSFADKCGRRNNCILYGLLYIATCVAANFNNFWILLGGRLCGGIATSLLFSCFESWVVSEHVKREYSPDLLGVLFSNAALINSGIAIISGVVAQYAAEYFGYTAPFNLSIGILGAMILLTACTWSENFGSSEGSFGDSFSKAIKHIKTNPNILCLGLVQGLFEGTMYTFVLEWTPAMSQAYGSADISHGYIFAAFMVAVMLGSTLFKLLSKYVKVENFMRFVLAAGALCMAAPIVFPKNIYVVFGAFLIFEACVGIFWPAMGYLRGVYVPEEARTTIINLFRIPLNLIVIFILLMNFPMFTIFCFCIGFMVLAVVAQHLLYWRTRSSQQKEESAVCGERVELTA